MASNLGKGKMNLNQLYSILKLTLSHILSVVERLGKYILPIKVRIPNDLFGLNKQEEDEKTRPAQSTGAVEYTNLISAEG